MAVILDVCKVDDADSMRLSPCLHGPHRGPVQRGGVQLEDAVIVDTSTSAATEPSCSVKLILYLCSVSAQVDGTCSEDPVVYADHADAVALSWQGTGQGPASSSLLQQLGGVLIVAASHQVHLTVSVDNVDMHCVQPSLSCLPKHRLHS